MKRMVGRLAEDRDGLDAGYFPCAAVVSTRVLPGDERVLVGVPYRDADAEILAVREQACPEPGALELQVVGSAWLQQGASAPYTRGAARTAA